MICDRCGYPANLCACQSSSARHPLDDLRALLARYVAFPSEAALDAVTLWAAHTHCVEAFESTPRLALISPEKQAGKTRTLEVLDLVVPNPMHAVNCTPAALFRAVAAKQPVLLFDEADTYFGPKAKKDHEELRGLVNAGHRRGAVAWRCVGEGSKQEVREFPAYAAVAMAGIGDLPDTILDRAVVITMKRRASHEHVDPFRLRKVKPAAEEIRKRLEAWAAEHEMDLAFAEPDLPEGITDRPADVWEPLVAVGDVAGGDWPQRARTAAVELNKARVEADPSLGVKLLTDIHAVFNGTDRMPTEALLDLLHDLDESPWGDLRGRPLDARGLARRLRPYGVRPDVIRIGDTTPRGYMREWFHDAWERWLSSPSPVSPQQAQQAQQPRSEAVEPVADSDSVVQREPQQTRLTDELVADVKIGPQQNPQQEPAENPPLQGKVADVADVALPEGKGRDTRISDGSDHRVCQVCGAAFGSLPELLDHGARHHGPSKPTHSTTYRSGAGKVFEPGDRLRVKGERGAYVFLGYSRNTTRDGREVEWIECRHAQEGHHRSFRPERCSKIREKEATR